MKRRAVIRYLVLGGLLTGLASLSGAGVDPAAAGESSAAVCRSTFGENGPVGGSVVGEGPTGDPMTTTIGWDPFDWSDGLSEIVTCVSVSGRSAPALTTTMPTPRNDGSLVVSLTLPPGEPGSRVCEQSVLVGAGAAAGRQRTTSPVCFKLRAGDAAPGSGVPAAGPVATPAPPAPAAPAGPPAPSPRAPAAPAPPAHYPASTPPARAAFEAARGGARTPAAHQGAPDPLVSVAVPSPAWPDPASPAPAAKAVRPATAAPVAGAQAVPAAALARTGIDKHMLASAGGFLAMGGAAIIFGAPGRRRVRAR